MLLNLSNHPSSNWTLSQLQEAQNQYGSVKDVAFPHIEPTANTQAIKQLAEEYYLRVLAHKPEAVHLMGEMTFTFALVKRLRQAQITCLASTSNRMVVECGSEKRVKFQFVQFRAY